MHTPPQDEPMQEPRAAAAKWFVELQSADLRRETQEDFADWLRRSPVNVEEFLRYTALHGELARLDELQQVDVAALLANAQHGNVVALDPQSPSFAAGASAAISQGERLTFPPGNATAPPTHRRAKVALAAGLVAAVAGVASLIAWHGVGMERYTTAVGEQRSLVLADGSQVQLNVRSTLVARVNEASRELHLEDGEALFQVAKDAARPFRVHTPDAVIEALGTRFNVHVKHGRTIVALLEGRVDVKRSNGGAAIAMHPGEEITVLPDILTLPTPQAANMKSVLAWTERRLVFDDEPLAEVVAEFNRYSRQPLTIDDPSLRDIRITASFDSGSAQTFADTLASAGRLHVRRRADGSWLIER